MINTSFFFAIKQKVFAKPVKSTLFVYLIVLISSDKTCFNATISVHRTNLFQLVQLRMNFLKRECQTLSIIRTIEKQLLYFCLNTLILFSNENGGLKLVLYRAYNPTCMNVV